MKSMIYIFLVIFFFFSACDQHVTTPDSENDSSVPKGMIKLSLDMTNAPSEVVRLEEKLDANDRDDIHFDFEISGNLATALVEDIPSGIWMLTVNSFDVNDVIIYTGTTEVNVYSGVVTPVSIHLNPTNGSLEITVTWGEILKDIDGNVYRVVRIGDQIWMGENLKVTHYRNGEAIPNVTNGTEWVGLSSGAYCSYDNDEGNIETYGLLYNWYAVNDYRNIAPDGWHVPTDAEWQTMIDYLGGDAVAGGKLKKEGNPKWNYPYYGAHWKSKFSALPGSGRFGSEGVFGIMGGLGRAAWFWSATEDSSYSIRALGRLLVYDWRKVGLIKFRKLSGFSIRCIKD